MSQHRRALTPRSALGTSHCRPARRRSPTSRSAQVSDVVLALCAGLSSRARRRSPTSRSAQVSDLAETADRRSPSRLGSNGLQSGQHVWISGKTEVVTTCGEGDPRTANTSPRTASTSPRTTSTPPRATSTPPRATRTPRTLLASLHAPACTRTSVANPHSTTGRESCQDSCVSLRHPARPNRETT